MSRSLPASISHLSLKACVLRLTCCRVQHEAVATSLCAIVPTGLAGTFHNFRRRAVDVRWQSLLCLLEAVPDPRTAIWEDILGLLLLSVASRTENM